MVYGERVYARTAFSGMHALTTFRLIRCNRAGAADVFAQTCSGLCTDLIGEPSNYNNAYFEFRSIKAYTGAPTTRSITAATQVNTTTTTSGTGSNANTPSSGTTGAGVKNGAHIMTVLAFGAAIVAFVL